MEAIRETGGELDDLNIQDSDGGSMRTVEIVVRAPEPDDLGEIATMIGARPEVVSCKIRGAPGNGAAATAVEDRSVRS
jgi:hypothetical protein